MANGTIAQPALALGPGVVWTSDLTASLPTPVVSGSVFTDTWPAGWTAAGQTDAGSTFNYAVTTDGVETAESLDPLVYVVTGRTGSFELALTSVTAMNLKRAMNGGTLVTTGTTGTSLTTYTPPVPGTEARKQVGWESQDGTERIIAQQCLQTGSIALARAKGSARATLPMTYNIEIPSTGNPWTYYAAGVARLGV